MPIARQGRGRQCFGLWPRRESGFDVIIDVLATGFLFWVRKGMKPVVQRLGVGEILSGVLVKIRPVVVIVATTGVVWVLDLADKGVKIVGEVSQSLPSLTMPSLSPELLGQLLLPAFMISIVCMQIIQIITHLCRY